MVITGFTRNGISVTDGAIDLTIQNSTISECGLAGIDVEANTGAFTQIYNLKLLNLRILNNGDDSLRTDGVVGNGIQIVSPLPAVYHSEGVTVKDVYYKTTTATNANGINYFKIGSVRGLTYENNLHEKNYRLFH